MSSVEWPAPPPPWERRFLRVGGVCGVGFSADGKWFMVVSHNGRGLFDCQTSERIARDPSHGYGSFDDASETVSGLGPLEGQRVPVTAIRGPIPTRRQLPTTTGDGWEVSWQEAEERLGMPDTPIYLRGTEEGTRPGNLLGEFELLVAVGFSPTGRVLVIAESHTITVFSR